MPSPDTGVTPPDLTRLRRLLPSALDVAGLASRSVTDFAGAVSAHLLASGGRPRRWVLDADRIAAAYGSDRLLRLHGKPVSMFAELSGFFPTRDGWIRTHANYPHHRQRLCRAVGLPHDTAAAEFAATVAAFDAHAIEEATWAAGALAVRVREPGEWTPSAARSGSEAITGRRSSPRRPHAPQEAPLSGIRVLDLTRVIAGPVATRSLALLGADVLRIDPPTMPEIAVQHVDTGQGKRSTLLDAKTASGLAAINALLADADVLVSGYRPQSIEALGLELPPGLVHATVDAWGDTPGWQDRRGFDSLVQAVTGISMIESKTTGPGPSVPGALPVQALDHSAGYMLAAAVVRALTDQIDDPRGRRISVSLAGVAAELLQGDRYTSAPERPALGDDVVVTHGDVTTARPALAEFADYAAPAHPLGADAPVWLRSPQPTQRASRVGGSRLASVDQMNNDDRYGSDVLADFSRRPAKIDLPVVEAVTDLVLEDVASDFCGSVVRIEGRMVELEDRKGRRRMFPLGPGFLLEGTPVAVRAPRTKQTGLGRTASGSIAGPQERARVARASRIFVEGRHDAELVEKVWGSDLRSEGVVVEYLEGVDHLEEVLAEFRPGPGRRVGVLVDHLVPNSKESRIAEKVARGPHSANVIVVGHPYVDVWQSVKPQRLGLTEWPVIPRSIEWKHGICEAFGWPHAEQADIARAWQRILSRVSTYTDLEPQLLGRVEQLIDFVTAE